MRVVNVSEAIKKSQFSHSSTSYRIDVFSKSELAINDNTKVSKGGDRADVFISNLVGVNNRFLL